ncbi:MAG: hypothetical protein IPO89_13270 [Actinomycetales bacterium]|nr:hypothetical protein [Candidatus Lutibacillus vidarii]
MDERTWSVVSSFQAFLDEAVAAARGGGGDGATPLRETIDEHLGPDADACPWSAWMCPPTSW